MQPKYTTWTITVRPHGGITNEQIAGVSKWITRTCDYYHIITHKDGSERHMHAAMFIKRETVRSNLNSCLGSVTCLKDLTEAEKGVLRKGTKVMYDWNFISEYLAKHNPSHEKYDPFHKVVASKLPPLDEREAVGKQRFPEKDDKRMEHKFEGDPWLLKMEALFKDWLCACTEPLRESSLVWPAEDCAPAKRYECFKESFGGERVMGRNGINPLANMVVATFYNSVQNIKRLVKVERDPKKARNNIIAMAKFFAQYGGASTAGVAKRSRAEDEDEGPWQLEQHRFCPRCEEDRKSPVILRPRELYCDQHKRYDAH